MADDELAEQIAAVRREIAPALPKNVDPKTVELAAFSAVGRRELALRVWTDSREAATAARRSKGKALRERFGARNPNGWLSFVAFGGALCAAVAAVLTSGFRFDPAETSAATAILAALAGVAGLIVLIVAAGRPLNRSMIRIHGIMTAGLVIAAALMLSRGPGVWAVVVAASAVVSVVGMVVILVSRARDHGGTEEIDTAINVALADTKPEVEAVSLRLQSEVATELGSQDAARIVRIRTAVLAELASEGIPVAAVHPEAPAGSVIIDDLLGMWVPEVLRGEI
ncbi:hypothetical protein [Microbacterium sp. CPCC 204701]|uniref:hypothetical protein n=1 Tax=Microbacterium sp. CPCC 204701 TaxID=2493084 RepID=UPI000FD6E1F2|nr:hypothetical protein [Microbacterium sp. CPCC 204701]